ncbi:MAG: DNA repair protein RadC [Spirochaetota bacterium]
MAETLSVYERETPVTSRSLDIRERLLRSGAPAVSDAELVAAILGSGNRHMEVRTLAAHILGKCDFSAGVPDIASLTDINGLGQAQACRISAALELGKRFYGIRDRRIATPADAWHLVRHFADRKQERFLCCTLNGAHDVLAVRIITLGLANRTIVHPREVFAEAVADRACAILVAHNHPSGRLEPSREDEDITERIRDAGELLGIPLLDHIIFSQDGYASMMEQGLLKTPGL